VWLIQFSGEPRICDVSPDAWEDWKTQAPISSPKTAIEKTDAVEEPPFHQKKPSVTTGQGFLVKSPVTKSYFASG
jgi:hypothetical protein